MARTEHAGGLLSAISPARSLAAAAALLGLLGGAPAYPGETPPQCGEVTGDPELAIKVCTRLIEFGGLGKSDLAKAYHARGAEWANQGNYDRAIADFSTAIDLEPGLADVHFNRALAWSEKGDHDRAIDDYDAALKIAPRNARAHVGRAVEWTVKGDYKRATADYDAAIRLEPKAMAGYFGRGRVRFYAGDFMGAASDLMRAHQLDASAYTALWIYLARKRADIPGEATLAQDAGTSGSGEWPAPVIGLYLGRFTPESVLKAASGGSAAVQREKSCEASFYVAHWHLIRNARDAALPLLREAVKLCPSSFIEHEGALAELRR